MASIVNSLDRVNKLGFLVPLILKLFAVIISTYSLFSGHPVPVVITSEVNYTALPHSSLILYATHHAII